MPIDNLKEYLKSTTPGALTDSGVLERLLADCWDELSGASAGGMHGWKLLGRMEHVHWNPPVLSFTIERHGGTPLGSTRAEPSTVGSESRDGGGHSDRIWSAAGTFYG